MALVISINNNHNNPNPNHRDIIFRNDGRNFWRLAVVWYRGCLVLGGAYRGGNGWGWCQMFLIGEGLINSPLRGNLDQPAAGKYVGESLIVAGRGGSV